MRRYIVIAVIFLAFAATASAQTIVINPNKPGVLPSPSVQPVRISLGINMFVPTPDNDPTQMLKAQEDGRKLVYQAAASECGVLRDVLAKDCRLESININVQHVPANQNFNGGAKVDGYNINGSVNFEIAPK